jgi:mxaJ protein
MSSRSRKLGVPALLLAVLLGGCARKEPRVLRVCADPNNLPFSNRKLAGFENEIAALLAKDLGAKVEYTWWAQRRGFFRNTLKAGLCDVAMGVPSSFELALTTRPYYRSTYVFVTRRDGGPVVRSFDDPVLRTVRVGVQLAGDDGYNPPPAHALARRGVVQNVSGYTLYGDYTQANPPARIIDAVARGEVGVAVVWGPLAGYFAQRSPVALRLTPVSPQIDLPYLPFVFDISLGVRRGETALRDELDAALDRRQKDIDAILGRYGVPRVDPHGEVR